VPFTVSIPPSDVIPDFKETLLAEASGILRWMVEGCLEWQKVGLAPPPSVVEATRQYQESEDVIGNFLQEAGFDSSRLARPEVYRIYEAWARDLGFDALPSVQLYEILRAKGFGEIKSRGHWYFTNLPVGGASWRSHELEETWDKQAQG